MCDLYHYELNHTETVFKHQNSYTAWVIDKFFMQVQQAQQVSSNTSNEKKKRQQEYTSIVIILSRR